MFHFIVVLLFSCSDSEKNYSFGGADAQNEDSGMIDSDLPEEDTAEPTLQDTAENQGTESCDTLTLSSTITVDACNISPESGAISYLEEWSIEEFMPFPEYNHILSVPVVVQLDDDNGDGRISQEDTADIVFITDDGGLEPQTHGVLRIVSEGELLYSAGSFESNGDQAYPYRYSGISIADINLDGWPEIVGVTEIIPGPTGEEGEGEDPNDDSPVRPNDPSSGNNCYVFAADREANLLWIAREASFACGGHHPAIADLEGDGSVEVVLGNTIIAGEDGTVVAIGDGGDGVYEAYEGIGSITVVHDLDLDGEQEIIAGNTLYDAQGNVRCSLEVSDGFAGVADLNQDGMGEWVVVGNGEVAVADVDCNQLAGWELLSWGTGGPPTIDDFDMDGEMEIAISDANIFAVYEVDGSLLW
ncbi:MAG: hypothetical protein VX278_02175, partial [Myxococcota bacterium]|nr:hypothetical protein [Myxococcota bacterium]